MGKRSRAVACAFAASIAPVAADAAPWPREKGRLLLISGAEYFRADLPQIETPEGDNDQRFERLQSNTYFEYGLTDAVTLGGKVVYGTSWLTRGPEVETASGFSEIEGFVQYRIHASDNDVASLKIAGVRPSRFQSGVRPEIASDGADLRLSGLYGRALRDAGPKIFTGIEAGYRRRFSASADQAEAQASLGVEPGARWLLLLDGFATVSLGEADPGGANFDIYKIQPSLVWRAGRRWTFQAGVAEEIAGRNVALGRTVFLNLWSEF